LRKPLGGRRRDYSKHAYWRRALKQLHGSYSGICAYTCHWIPFDTGFSTVEHFRPKETTPRLAYEWSNYRLVCGTLNGRKGSHGDVLDPFLVEDGWFVLDFPSLLVKPASGLSAQRRRRVERTISRLKLNDDETCVQARFRWVMDYRNDLIAWPALQRDAPFIAAELVRQGLQGSIATIM
jgi:hypothetical protein